MKVIYPLIAVVFLGAIAFAGVSAGLDYLFGVIIPYFALLVFLVGFIWRIYDWVKSPVPFGIPTTCARPNPWNGLKKMNWKAHQDFGVWSEECRWRFCFSALCSATQKQK